MNRYINENDKKMDELLQKYIAGNASEKESQRIMEWLREDEQHLREYKRQRKLYDITSVSYTHLRVNKEANKL